MMIDTPTELGVNGLEGLSLKFEIVSKKTTWSAIYLASLVVRLDLGECGIERHDILDKVDKHNIINM
jgi:hypothetical protein